MTATLQQDASRRLGFSAVKTMVIAQQLYEGLELGDAGAAGLITYMRTDSLPNVAATAKEEAKQFIKSKYGEAFLPPQARVYKTKSKSAQEAHEAIRPTLATRTPESIKTFLTSDQFKLYNLIWCRFLASQMADAIFDTVGVDIDAAVPGQPTRYLFHASGRTVKAPGFLKVYEEPDEKEAAAKKEEGQKASRAQRKG